LQESFFEDGGFYQQDERLLNDLPFSIHHIKQARSVLKTKDLITVKSKGLPAKNHYTVNVDKVLELIGLKYMDENPTSQSPRTSLDSYQKPGNTNNKETNNKDTKSGDELLLDKIIEIYPGNINSKTPLLKALKVLTKEEKILAIKNIERYKKAANGYYLNLRNYLESKAFSEIELKKKEESNKLKTGTFEQKRKSTDKF
jgi:hypothetical protein